VGACVRVRVADNAGCEPFAERKGEEKVALSRLSTGSVLEKEGGRGVADPAQVWQAMLLTAWEANPVVLLL